MKKLITLLLTLSTTIFTQGCSAMNFKATNKKLDIDKFMGTWYVQTGRVTFLEKGAHNPIEHYQYNESKKIIEISFTFNKDSLNGKLKKIPQTGYIQNTPINTYWKVSPFWPIKLDYLVLDFDQNYQWTAIGVPSGKYLWIMTRDRNPKEDYIKNILKQVSKTSYPITKLEVFNHNK